MTATDGSAGQQQLQRRGFLKAVSRDAIVSAAQVAGYAFGLRSQVISGIADAVRGGPSDEADAPGNSPQPRNTSDPADSANGANQAHAGRTAVPGVSLKQRQAPYRAVDDALWVLDQSVLPDRPEERRLVSVDEVVATIREWGPGAASLLGVIAAHGVWVGSLDPEIGWESAARQLCGASSLPSVEWALQHVQQAVDARPLESSETLIARVRRAAHEVDDLVSEDLRLLARRAADRLPLPSGRALRILTLGSVGRMSGGRAGTVEGIAAAVAGRGATVHVSVLETRPSMLGQRISAPDLAAAGIPVTVAPDVAADWLLNDERTDVVIVGSEAVGTAGDTTAVIGTATLARLAHARSVPFYVAAPPSHIAMSAGSSEPARQRDRHSVAISTEPTRIISNGHELPAVPLTDVTPASDITGFFTERGLVRSPLGAAS